jgi:hypothetical protein
MDSNLNTCCDNFPVSQEDGSLQGPEMDLWEAPFERWLRLADFLLGNVPPARPSAPRKI